MKTGSAILLGLLVPFAGCASAPKPSENLSIPAGNYPAAFQAAKDVLRNYEFELDRVDAREGIITTAPRAWSGAATPWLPYSSQPLDAVEGLMQFEQRTARVEFRPASDTAAEIADLRDFQGELTAEVTVTVERLYRPGRRVDATSVRLTSFSRDPKSSPRGGPPQAFATEVRQDTPLAARIQADLIRLDPNAAPAAPLSDP